MLCSQKILQQRATLQAETTQTSGEFSFLLSNTGERVAVIKKVEYRIAIYEEDRRSGERKNAQLYAGTFQRLYFWTNDADGRQDPFPIILDPDDHLEYSAILSPPVCDSLLTIIGRSPQAMFEDRLWGIADFWIEYDESEKSRSRTWSTYFDVKPGIEFSEDALDGAETSQLFESLDYLVFAPTAYAGYQ